MLTIQSLFYDEAVPAEDMQSAFQAEAEEEAKQAEVKSFPQGSYKLIHSFLLSRPAHDN